MPDGNAKDDGKSTRSQSQYAPRLFQAVIEVKVEGEGEEWKEKFFERKNDMNTDEQIEARVAARIKGEAKGLAGAKLEQYIKTAVRNRFRNKLRDSQAYSQSNFENRMASFEGLAESGHVVDSLGTLQVLRDAGRAAEDQGRTQAFSTTIRRGAKKTQKLAFGQ